MLNASRDFIHNDPIINRLSKNKQSQKNTLLLAKERVEGNQSEREERKREREIERERARDRKRERVRERGGE